MSYPAQKFENNAILKQNCNLKLFIAFKRPNIVVSVVFKKVLSLSLITLTVAFCSWHPNCSFTHRDEGVKVFVQNVVRLVQLGRRPEFLPQDRLGRVLRASGRKPTPLCTTTVASAGGSTIYNFFGHNLQHNYLKYGKISLWNGEAIIH